MPDVETAEMENPDVETPGEITDEATDVVTPESEVEIDTTEVDTVEIEPVEVDKPVVEEAVANEEAEATDESDVEGEEVAQVSASPFDMPGDWYVIHSYSGYENKVKANLETRIQSMHMEDRIFEVHIPMEDMVEFKGGKKQTVSKKVFPGYILVRMTLDDDSWYAVRNTPGVTGFVAGNAQKPTPLSRREVERFLGVQEEEEKAKPRFKPEWEVGEQVRVVTGPFADFNGVIEDMNIDQQKIVVLVNIFGRDTPVELGFEDIQKS
ncbi:MAG: transcription termination/antitermination protein NusG [Acidimicrobiia bacterium]